MTIRTTRCASCGRSSRRCTCAHSWTGTLVPNGTWRDTWLNEGFTTYLEGRIVEQVYGEKRRAMEQGPGLQALRREPQALAPGRGPALTTPEEVAKGLDYTRDFVTTLLQRGREAVEKKLDLKGAMAHTRAAMDAKSGHVFIYEHCLPFDVARAYDEASGIKHPRVWTAERDKDMWAALQD